MGLKRVKISELRLSEVLKGLFTIGYRQCDDGTTESVQVGLEFVGNSAKDASDAARRANESADKADTQSERAKELADHPTRMGENGNWWEWNEGKKDYEDTGVLAKGGILYPNFYIDDKTMELYMAYQDEIATEQFKLEDGCLCFKFR